MTKGEHESLVRLVSDMNDLLGMPIPQYAKATICTAIERTLMDHRAYSGYNNRYWLNRGFTEWNDAGQPGGPAKEKYIVGPAGANNRHHSSPLSSNDQGEYSRQYYLGKLIALGE